MSNEEEIGVKRGLNLNVKMSPGIMITIIISVLGGVISITRFADSKTTREDVEKIVDSKLERVIERLDGFGNSLEEIKSTLKDWGYPNNK